MNIAAFINGLAGGGVLNITLTYTDEGGVLKTLTFGPYAALNAVAPISPQVIYVERGTSVDMTTNWNINGNSCNLYAQLEVLNVLN